VTAGVWKPSQYRTIVQTFRAKNIGRKTFCLATGNVLGGTFKLAHRRRVLLAIVLS
jgi:hypothetical protein